MTRYIRRRKPAHNLETGHHYPLGWTENDWVVVLHASGAGNGSGPGGDSVAFIHHNHRGGQNHDLCGPLIFCCQGSLEAYRRLYPSSPLASAQWGAIPAEQIACWMDAGVQVIYFIFCDPGAPRGLTAAALTGKQARRVLFREAQLGAIPGCLSLLSEIARDGYQDGATGEGDFSVSLLSK